MKKEIVDFIKYSPIESGLIFLILESTMLIFHLNKKKNIKFWDSNVMEWKFHGNYLAIMAMSFIFGLILIIKNI
ncbi:hypothetical protein [Polaribacter sp. Hel1_85]|uniref:hypothetical protein n=1 Tax=Polaribacter sp. Hel1_85 TaxID=1250005 RepID=UPI00052CCD15|nr:hypothetical protein [Polaribacter sp. Hel1_85]KGL63030.1 hypothetical protein PHEL85_0061 [Polaribacter sp. Hel1_85]